MIEMINKVLLRGVVGYANVTVIGTKKHVKFALCTQYLYKNKSGESIMEITWTNISAFEDQVTVGDIDSIDKGKAVKVEGRLRQISYVNEYGDTIRSYEVIAHDVKIIKNQTV